MARPHPRSERWSELVRHLDESESCACTHRDWYLRSAKFFNKTPVLNLETDSDVLPSRGTT